MMTFFKFMIIPPSIFEGSIVEMEKDVKNVANK